MNRRAAMAASSHVVVLATAAFWRHPAWARDFELAIELGKPVVLVRIAGAEVPAAFEATRARITGGITEIAADSLDEAAPAIMRAMGARPGDSIMLRDGALPNRGEYN